MTPEPPKPHRDRIEPICWLLFAGSVIFAFMMCAMAKWAPDDGQIFTALTMLASGYASSLWTRVKPAEKKPEAQRGE